MAYGNRRWFAMLDINAHDSDSTAPVTFGLEFLDLKSKSAEDGKTHSICVEEGYSENIEDICLDILVDAIDGSVKTNRYILASNSPVFKAMFSENWSQTSTVNLDEMSIGACKAMLNMLDNKKKSSELHAYSVELLTAADKYDIAVLKEACEDCWCEIVGAKNVFSLLQIARGGNLLKLEKTCLFYLVKMGVIYGLGEDHNTFLREADHELIVLLTNACLDA